MLRALSLRDCEIRFSAFICRVRGDVGKLYLISLLLPFLRDRETVLPLTRETGNFGLNETGDSFFEISFFRQEFLVVGLSSGKKGQCPKSEEGKTGCFFQRGTGRNGENLVGKKLHWEETYV